MTNTMITDQRRSYFTMSPNVQARLLGTAGDGPLRHPQVRRSFSALESNDPTSNTATGVSSALAELVPTLSKIIRISVNNNSSAND
uniref:Uncharacterized protein n=1 Tax=Zea mays TaxID=4577 RepID=C0PAR6_MAIZE|nr:unknown [Zea mays]ACN31460.1 unknown [Zea mays]